MTEPYLRRMRSAESWIGVSGFLISWAMRRATSPQADVRCAETSSVTSSKVMTLPWSSLPSLCSRVTRTAKMRSSSLMGSVTWLCARRLQARLRVGIGKCRQLGNHVAQGMADQIVRLQFEQLLRRGVGEPDGSLGIEADHAGGDVRQHRLHEQAALGELGIGVDELAVLATELLGHVIEVLGEPPQIAFAAVERQLDREVALGDLLGGADQPPYGRNDLAREPQLRPCA